MVALLGQSHVEKEIHFWGVGKADSIWGVGVQGCRILLFFLFLLYFLLWAKLKLTKILGY